MPENDPCTCNCDCCEKPCTKKDCGCCTKK